MGNQTDARVSPCRIARVITRLNIGGPSIQAIDLSRELRRSGFETCLIHGALSVGEGDMTSILPIADLHSVRVANLGRAISPWNDLRAFWTIYRTLCAWQPEIVHTHMAKAGTLGRLAALLYNRTRGRKAPPALFIRITVTCSRGTLADSARRCFSRSSGGSAVALTR